MSVTAARTLELSDQETTRNEAGTVVDLFDQAVRARGSNVAMRYRDPAGAWEPISWAAYGASVTEVAAAARGARGGSRRSVAILSANRFEWHEADMGILAGCAISVPGT